MKKILIALFLTTSLASIQVQGQEIFNMSADQKTTDITQDRKARLVAILDIAPEDQSPSNEELIKIMRKKQQEIEARYKEDYGRYQSLNIEYHIQQLITAFGALGLLALLFISYKANQRFNKERDEVYKQYITSIPLGPLQERDKALFSILNKNFILTSLVSIASMLDTCWIALLSNRKTVNDADMQKLIDEYAFLEDEIRRLQGNNCLEEGTCLPLSNLLMLAR